MKIYLHTIGCRLNLSELETTGRRLLGSNHEITGNPAEAQAVIINTCFVTAKAASDTRSILRRVMRLNPSAIIAATGCYATIASRELKNICPDIRIIPNSEKDRLADIIDPARSHTTPDFRSTPLIGESTGATVGRTRAFIKVQDGCDNRCTFCVTSIARGPERSRPAAEIISEINSLAEAGFKEAILSGVHIGAYGRGLPETSDLHDLVGKILKYTGIERLRLSSLEPWNIKPGFFSLWENPRLMPHLHLPLQSGSDIILKRMARRATTASFRELVAEAHSAIKDLNISTDIIVGFPGETDDDFKRTIDFIKELEFGRIHAFSYSKRPGTAACDMPDQVEQSIKKERVRILIETGKELSLMFHRKYEGKTRSVLWETPAVATRQSGYTDNYIRINTRIAPGNTITPALLSNPSAGGMQGQPVPS